MFFDADMERQIIQVMPYSGRVLSREQKQAIVNRLIERHGRCDITAIPHDAFWDVVFDVLEIDD